MEVKKGIDKKIIIIISAVALVAIAIVVGLVFFKKDDGYRTIQVYEVNGEAQLERENVGNMAAYENLNLISGDLLSVLQKSYLRLKMDSDKYVLVEEDSVVSIYATGSKDQTKTDIQLEKGSVTVEVQNKLSEDSTFEVTTPNSVMAIRGTVFRVSVEVDENGQPKTRIAILEGAVTVQKKDKEGNLTEETLIPAGKEAIIYMENEQEVLLVLDEIEIKNISDQALEFIKDVAENGRELHYSLEEIKEEIKVRTERNDESETEGGLEENIQSEVEGDATENSETEEADDSERGNVTKDEDDSERSSETKDEDDSEGSSETKDEDDSEGSSETKDEDDSEESSETKDEDDSEESSETEDKADAEQNSESEDNDESDSSNDGEEGQKEVVIVTFMYDGKIFATQEVIVGTTVDEPKLRPMPTGYWDFDFSTVITEETVIEFIEE